MLNHKTILLGSDPEVFIRGKNFSIDGVKVTGLIPPAFFRLYYDMNISYDDEDKEKKHPIFLTSSNGVSIHEDGAAVEITTKPEVYAENLIENINYIYNMAEAIFSKFDVFGGIEVASAMPYDANVWTKFGPVMIWANRAGCDPDKDAFDYNKNEIMDFTTFPWRFGGGHIHVSTNDKGVNSFMDDDERVTNMVKLMAIYVGTASIAFSPNIEQDSLRMVRYGKPGKYRKQVFKNGYKGIEYRTPSNLWTSNSDVGIALLEKMKACFAMLDEPETVFDLVERFGDSAKNIVLDADIDKAQKFFYGLPRI